MGPPDILRTARDRLSNALRTHWEGCESDHDDCLMMRLADEVQRLREEVQRLQRALSFWLPGMPLDIDGEIGNRLANDIDLLVGFDGPGEASAEDLGWIALAPNVLGVFLN